MSFDIDSERLALVAQGPDDVRAMLANISDEDRRELSSDWLRMVEEATECIPWIHGFVATLRVGGNTIGNCGFKGPPNGSGEVEIAYGVAPEHEGNGYATEMAMALAAFAFEDDAVRAVLAHTLPENNASTRVLTKAGFDKVGEVVDPDDGPVWRWRRDR